MNLKPLQTNQLPPQETSENEFDSMRWLIDLTKEIPDPIPVYSIGSKILCSPGNILTIKAKQKAGKTMLVQTFIASNFRGNYLNINSNGCKSIGWIDTEQSENEVYKRARITHSMSRLDPKTNSHMLHIYYAKMLDIEERWELLEAVCASGVQIVVCDVSTDWVLDINDVKETKVAIDRFGRLAAQYNLLIICTLHENKKDTNGVGHFGGTLQKKSEAVISLTKSEGLFEVSATDTRHGDWEPFSFSLEDGIPRNFDRPQKLSARELASNLMVGTFRHVLAGKRLSHGELVTTYSQYSGKSERTARSHVAQCLKSGLLRISENFYTLKNDTQD